MRFYIYCFNSTTQLTTEDSPELFDSLYTTLVYTTIIYQGGRNMNIKKLLLTVVAAKAIMDRLHSQAGDLDRSISWFKV